MTDALSEAKRAVADAYERGRDDALDEAVEVVRRTLTGPGASRVEAELIELSTRPPKLRRRVEPGTETSTGTEPADRPECD